MSEFWLSKAQFREVVRKLRPSMTLREFNIAWAQRLLLRGKN